MWGILKQLRLKGEADRLLEQGIEKCQIGQVQEALFSWDKALQIYRELNNRPGMASSLGNLGNIFQSLGQYQTAIDYQQQSLAIKREIGDQSGQATSLGNLGNAYYSLEQYQTAINYHQQSLAIRREIGDRSGEAISLGNLGISCQSLGQYEQAINYHLQTLAVRRDFGDRSGEATSLGNLGVAYYSLGHYPKAIEYHEIHLAIAREIGDRSGEAISLGNLGNAYQAFGLYSKAIEFHQYSLTIERELGNLQGKAASLSNLGVAYNSLGQYLKAIEYYQQSLAIAREIDHRSKVAASLGNLGLAYLSIGKFPEALDYCHQTLALKREIGDPQGEATALHNLGSIYHSLGQYTKVIEYYQQSLAIFREMGDRRGEAASLNNLGVTYDSLGQHLKALDHQQQSLSITREINDRQGEADALGNLGNTYEGLGQYPKAIEYHQQYLAIAREIKDREGESRALGNLGTAYGLLGQYLKAIEYLQHQLAIAREIGFRKGEAISLGNLGAVYNSLKQYAEAEKILNASIEVFESIRVKELSDADKVALFETYTRTYHSLQTALIAQNKTDTALEISERSRARAFVELMAAKLTDNPIIHPLTLAQMQQIARQEKATLVEYYFNSPYETLYIWVLRPHGTLTFHSVALGSITLSDLVNNDRRALGIRGERKFLAIDLPSIDSETNRQKLYKLLIEPIESALPSNPEDKIIFIPHQELFSVSFAALQDKYSQYLVDKHTILTAPAIQVLQLTPKSRRTGNALIVGNPTMPKILTLAGQAFAEQLSPLPGAENEAKAIAQLLQTEPIIGERATKRYILEQLPATRIAHFATHGLLGDFKGLGTPGAIALAPDPCNAEINNGLLTSGEILDLKLNIDLLVLSACDTGCGSITGDGVIGLSRSLLTAGVTSLIVSLWAIPDSHTADLMIEFYRQWQNVPDKARALRQAQLNIKDRYPEPRNWAAFTIMGASS
jgi:tetratricopeptide (TPR) repeat protein